MYSVAVLKASASAPLAPLSEQTARAERRHEYGLRVVGAGRLAGIATRGYEVDLARRRGAGVVAGDGEAAGLQGVVGIAGIGVGVHGAAAVAAGDDG
jgi:hypothetical protein